MYYLKPDHSITSSGKIEIIQGNDAPVKFHLLYGVFGVRCYAFSPSNMVTKTITFKDLNFFLNQQG